MLKEETKALLKNLIKEILVSESNGIAGGGIVGKPVGTAWTWRLQGRKKKEKDLATFDPENPKFKNKNK